MSSKSSEERLDSLDPGQQDLIVGLLYRSGIWVANTEDSEGESDDSREENTVEKILEKLSEDSPSPFLRAAAARAAAARERWPVWEEDTFDILPDVRKAAGILRRLLPEKEYRMYKRALLKVATNVAQAGTEFAIESGADEEEGFFGKLMRKLRPAGQYDEGHPVNVSPGEDDALNRLARTLREVG